MNNINTQKTFGVNDFEDNLKALHKFHGRATLISIIGSIAKNHHPVALKGKENIKNRTRTDGIESSYYKSLLSNAVDSKLDGYTGKYWHANKLFYTDGAHGYHIIFNKYVYEDVMNHMYAMRKSLGI